MIGRSPVEAVDQAKRDRERLLAQADRTLVREALETMQAHRSKLRSASAAESYEQLVQHVRVLVGMAQDTRVPWAAMHAVAQLLTILSNIDPSTVRTGQLVAAATRAGGLAKAALARKETDQLVTSARERWEGLPARRRSQREVARQLAKERSCSPNTILSRLRGRWAEITAE